MFVRLVLGVLLVSLLGCQGPDFTQKRRLADPVMDLDEDASEERFEQKATYSREGAIGGVGLGGGGGCGCY